MKYTEPEASLGKILPIIKMKRYKQRILFMYTPDILLFFLRFVIVLHYKYGGRGGKREGEKKRGKEEGRMEGRKETDFKAVEKIYSVMYEKE